MASLLVGKSQEYWFEVCKSIGFRDKEKKEVYDTMWILSLSYYDLPPHLRTCLLYLSAFPEDYFIHKDSLIRTWIAEGFVKSKQDEPGLRLFEVGEGYFNDLINRSMIQGAELEMINEIIYGCRVHDMVLDLIRSFSHDENFVTVLDNNKDRLSGSNPRRLALQYRTEDHAPMDKHMDVRQVRSFIACRYDCVEQISFQGFEFLRVLHIENSGFHRLEHVGSLLHLRYLVLRNINIEVLPEEIGTLKFLQVLYLDGTGIRELPSSVGLLTRLICLCARGVVAPAGIIRKLTSLEELRIKAGDDNYSSRQFAEDVGYLRELRVLRISINSMHVLPGLWKSLGNLHDMQHLRLEDMSLVPIDDDTTKWSSVAIQRHLRYLSLPFVDFSKLPPCIHPSRVPNLSHLDLIAMNMDEQGLRILGGFPELRNLKLVTKCTATLTITPADGCFQKLTSFVLPFSMVHFVLHENSSGVSFTIWNGRHDTMTFRSKRENECRVAPAVMPNLQHLEFQIQVRDLVDNKGSCHNLGLEYLPSLQMVQVDFDCYGAFEDDVEKEEAALRHAIEVHPNRPTLNLNYWMSKRGMKKRSAQDDVAPEGHKEGDEVSSAIHDDATEPRRSEEETEAATP